MIHQITKHKCSKNRTYDAILFESCCRRHVLVETVSIAMNIYQRNPKPYSYYQSHLSPPQRIYIGILCSKCVPVISTFLVSLILSQLFLSGNEPTSYSNLDVFEPEMHPMCKDVGIVPEFMYETHAPYDINKEDVFLAIRLGDDQATNFKLMYETWMEFAPRHVSLFSIIYYLVNPLPPEER